MEIIDILLKLVPFTHKDDLGIVSFTTTLSFGDWIVTVIEILLFLIFLVSGWKLYRSYRKDMKSTELLEKATSDLKQNGFEYYNDFLNTIKDDTKIHHLWTEFDESLIKKETQDGKYLIRNSIDSEYFFNNDSMISHIGSKLYSAIPGILLGIGLLGTFFGLYVALVQLNVGDAEQLSNSIKLLINMAGVKFAASIWGLGLSIVFTFIDKGLEFSLDSKLEKIQRTINEMFERETAEQNLDKILVENKQQTKALNGLATALTEKISAEFNSILIPRIDKINDHFAPYTEKRDFYINNPKKVKEILEHGANKARKIASAKMEIVREAVGLNY